MKHLDPADTAAADGSGAMFDLIAHRYDLLNRVMSLGLDVRWRRALVESVRAACMKVPPSKRWVLDVATGTADVAIQLARRIEDVQVVGTDPSAAMLASGATKVARAGLQDRITLAAGDAVALPRHEDGFAAACISFGIRNVHDRQAGLAAMASCIRPGGRLAVLELGEPKEGLLGPLVRWHVHTLVPALGGLLSGSRQYRYLANSIAAFVEPPVFMKMMGHAGLCNVQHRRLSFGAVNLFWGDVPQ